MSEQKRRCKECGQYYMLYIRGANVPGGKDRETEVCPICGAENGTHMTSGIVTTERIKDDSKSLWHD